MLERATDATNLLRLISAEGRLANEDLPKLADAADVIEELLSRLATIESVLREFREADLDIVNIDVPTREVFERLHAAERSVDAVLGIESEAEDDREQDPPDPPKPRSYLTRGRRG